MPAVSSFRELNVYQRAVREADVLFRMTASFPTEERFALTDQLRRSSSSVAALIAEAWPCRCYQGAFTNTLRIAAGEVCETQAWLHHAQLRGYITGEAYGDLLDRWEHINAMLYSMIGKADQFAGRR